eukprot:TRINITY_DN2840_c0_g1_i1.p1 TRINITY_DN2840_c0_g1~~TRINITY_DN2840_c0_g1_i1.p1  ORF type:complete len:523 (+),score=50.25 TRINITY_DN2840_c0_g1_i1:64-1632(+)
MLSSQQIADSEAKSDCWQAYIDAGAKLAQNLPVDKLNPELMDSEEEAIRQTNEFVQTILKMADSLKVHLPAVWEAYASDKDTMSFTDWQCAYIGYFHKAYIGSEQTVKDVLKGTFGQYGKIVGQMLPEDDAEHVVPGLTNMMDKIGNTIGEAMAATAPVVNPRVGKWFQQQLDIQRSLFQQMRGQSPSQNLTREQFIEGFGDACRSGINALANERFSAELLNAMQANEIDVRGLWTAILNVMVITAIELEDAEVKECSDELLEELVNTCMVRVPLTVLVAMFTPAQDPRHQAADQIMQPLVTEVTQTVLARRLGRGAPRQVPSSFFGTPSSTAYPSVNSGASFGNAGFGFNPFPSTYSNSSFGNTAFGFPSTGSYGSYPGLAGSYSYGHPSSWSSLGGGYYTGSTGGTGFANLNGSLSLSSSGHNQLAPYLGQPGYGYGSQFGSTYNNAFTTSTFSGSPYTPTQYTVPQSSYPSMSFGNYYNGAAPTYTAPQTSYTPAYFGNTGGNFATYSPQGTTYFPTQW